MYKVEANRSGLNGLPKVLTGIEGLDDITEGGLPRYRPILVCGGAGSGKTLFAIEFLVRGARQYEDPGVFVSFEETAEELAQNVASLGLDLNDLVATKKMRMDYVLVDRSEIRETGDYNLEGLFVRLGYAIDSIGAKRVVLDSLETLLEVWGKAAMLREELRRLFRWLKEKSVTAIITAERGDGTLTRHGLEEYVSDCVILLDHRVNDQITTRRLRIVKYRGSRHGTNEYPFLITEEGLSVMPITSIGLNHTALTERISSGIPRLDTMLGGDGYYCGSSVLASGTAGTGKTSLGAHLMDATCRRGERCIAFLFEESPSQFIRNVRSIGIDLAPWITNGQLYLYAARPTSCGLETHLVAMYKMTNTFKPSVVVIDPVTNLISVGNSIEVRSMLTRLIDYFKTRSITTFFTSLNNGNYNDETSDVGISSLMDTWLLVKAVDANGERNRVLHVLKSRGMAHSNQVREFRLTDGGIELVSVYIGPDGVLTGTARLTQEAREQKEEQTRSEEFARRKLDLDRKRQAIEAQISALRIELEAAKEEKVRMNAQKASYEQTRAYNRSTMSRVRHAD